MALDLLLLTAYFPPDTGSAAHLFAELGQALASRGHRVTVLTGFPGYFANGVHELYRGRLRLRETVDGMTVVRTATPNLPRHIPALRALWQFSEAAALFSAGLVEPRASVALVYSPPLPLGIAAWGLRGLRRIPFVLNVQDLFPQSVIDLGLLRSPRAIWLAQGMERFVYRRAAHLTVHSEGNRVHLVRNGASPEKVSVIPNWVDTNAIRPGQRVNSLRRELGLEAGHFVVSFAGVMGYSQDLDTVLEAAAQLRSERDVVFLLVGDGVEKPRLEAKAQALRLANVRFLSMQPKNRYLLILSASDVCLVTLRAVVKTPVVPSKILSIMASGRPILAALHQDGDAARLVERAGAGICVTPENPEALADAVLRLRADRQWAEALGCHGRNYAEAELSLSSAVDRYEAVLDRVVSANMSLLPSRLLDCKKTLRMSANQVRPLPAKRIFDFVVSGLGLLASSPLWGLIALAIKLEDRGPVFYTQTRVGQGKGTFVVRKFRSMVPGAERMTGAVWAAPNDPRVTRVGRFLRATALDELPQLFSIFKGDMSFVGPRPERPEFVRQFAAEVPGYSRRFQIKPGLTGLAQIFGQYDSPPRRKLHYDLLYIRRQSVWLDLRLVCVSFGITIRGRWEHRGRKV